MTDTAAAAPANDVLPPMVWARVEIMGHRVHHGTITEVDQFGVKMLRVDVFAVGDQPIATHFYGGAAIYGITKITEEAAREAEAPTWRRQTGVPLAIAGPLLTPPARCSVCAAQKEETCLLRDHERDRCPRSAA